MPIHRKFKNVMHNYTPAEVKVREATSNDPWGPTAQMINELSELSYNNMLLGEMMGMIWKRLTDGGRNWRHVYKSLVLLDNMAKVGSEKVAQQCRANLGALEVLSTFEYVSDEGKDEGSLVREKSKQLVALLKDEQRFANQRAQAIQSRDRLKKNSGLSMGQSSNMRMPHSKSADRYLFSKLSLSGGGAGGGAPVLSEELEAVRPSNHGEEDLQLELALAISRQEHEAQEQQKKGDQLKLQMALEESKKLVNGQTQPTVAPSKPSDEWGIKLSNPWGGTTTDAWSAPTQMPSVVQSADPWGEDNLTVTKADPWGEVSAVKDPWASSLPSGNVMCAVPLVADPHNISDFVDDEFDLLSSRLKPRDPTPLAVNPGDLIGGLDPDVNEKRKKSAEDFLGENCTLVNLTQLLPQPPPQSVINPFALTIGKSSSQPKQFFPQQNNNKQQPLNKFTPLEYNKPSSNGFGETNKLTNVVYPQHLLANQNNSFQYTSSNWGPAVNSYPPPSIWPNSTLQPLPYPTNNNPFL